MDVITTQPFNPAPCQWIKQYTNMPDSRTEERIWRLGGEKRKEKVQEGDSGMHSREQLEVSYKGVIECPFGRMVNRAACKKLMGKRQG